MTRDDLKLKLRAILQEVDESLKGHDLKTDREARDIQATAGVINCALAGLVDMPGVAEQLFAHTVAFSYDRRNVLTAHRN